MTVSVGQPAGFTGDGGQQQTKLQADLPALLPSPGCLFRVCVVEGLPVAVLQ
ncbi:hypothetical protein [Accumulibacter sp.]|uniref:hypothetical protein n=1 Tax=Accumulibacter sp. TaxID=2053492 RepID=UPI003DAA13DD